MESRVVWRVRHGAWHARLDGLPENVWPDAEVNKTPAPWPTENDNEARGEALELLVLTSDKGWPYTGFRPCSERDVFVRREVLRVWHVVRRELARWPDDDSTFDPQPYVLVGTSGIGKSFCCASYLLHELLLYNAAKVPTVAYFVRGSVYIFHKTGAMAERVVLYRKADDALTVMWHMANERRKALIKRKESEGVKYAARKCRAKCGFIIFDAGDKHRPEQDLSTSEWGCVVLSAPNKSYYEGWMDRIGALPIYINCYTTREMRAFFARQQWCRCKTSERYQVRGTEIEQRWSVVERRIEEVGPQLRYVFDDKGYHRVCNDISVALSYFCASDMARYTSIILCKIQWTEYRRTDEIIKLVRVANGPVNDCLFFPISEAIGAKLKTLVVNYFLRRSYLVMAFEMPGLAPEVLWEFGLCAFMSESAVNKMVKKMKCLPSASPCPARESVLKRLKAAARHAQYHQVVALKIGGWQRGVSLEGEVLRKGVLYVPDLVNFPVLDAFYFVDVPPQDAGAVCQAGARGACAKWTIVCCG
ncbi:putative retrotransposon hot spot protein 4 (RHS4) [Trypanosoma vivax]|nr:putative retrotransposon hot spot protein 4 (RHS4) [Trypanosoma vivax]